MIKLFAQLVQVDAPEPVNRYFADAIAVFPQMLKDVFHCGMLDARGDDMPFFRLCRQDAANGGIIAFGAAGGKNNFSRVGVNERGHFPPGIVNILFYLPPEEMHA